jgi:hypothetical protein
MFKGKSFTDLLESLFGFFGLRPSEPRPASSPQEGNSIPKNRLDIKSNKSEEAHKELIESYDKLILERKNQFEIIKKWSRLQLLATGLKGIHQADLILGDLINEEERQKTKLLEDEYKSLLKELTGIDL